MSRQRANIAPSRKWYAIQVTKGREDIIRKIDRHRRIAYLNVDMLGDTASLQVGLEIESKAL